MTLNPATKLAADVATFVKRQFGDESGTQITDADIWRWIDSAQLEITSQIQPIKAKSITNVVAAQKDYDLTGLNVHQVESLHFDGQILPGMAFSEIEHVVQASGTFVDAGDPKYWYMWGNILSLWPVPATSITSGLEIYYTKMPTPITDGTSALSLPDKHFESILLWCMHKAHELDEEFGQSGEALSRFQARILDQNNEEYLAAHMTYQTITFVE